MPDQRFDANNTRYDVMIPFRDAAITSDESIMELARLLSGTMKRFTAPTQDRGTPWVVVRNRRSGLWDMEISSQNAAIGRFQYDHEYGDSKHPAHDRVIGIVRDGVILAQVKHG